MTTSISSEAQNNMDYKTDFVNVYWPKRRKKMNEEKAQYIKNDKNHETFIINTFCCVSHGLADKVSCILDAIWKMKPSQSKFSIYFNIRRKNHKYENADNKNQRSSFNSS